MLSIHSEKTNIKGQKITPRESSIMTALMKKANTNVVSSIMTLIGKQYYIQQRRT